MDNITIYIHSKLVKMQSLIIEAEGMKWENQFCISIGHGIKYGEEAFFKVSDEISQLSKDIMFQRKEAEENQSESLNEE